jgi:hypothetical protein
MKPFIPHAIAAALALGASVAVAQTNPMPQLRFVEEPTASAAKLDGPDAEFVKSLVESLNAEPSLKNTKITVQTEQDTGNVILTGATMTAEQAKKAAEIVTAQAGEGKVVNAIQSDRHPTSIVQPGQG